MSNSIVILGEARSGTTWLMELLGQLPNSAIQWEPMHMGLGVLKGKYNFGRRAYIPADNTDHSYLQLFEEMLTMKRISPWSTRFCNVIKFFTASFVITKFVKASLTLPWMVRQLNLKRKPIFILRHPIATAFSQIKTFSKDKATLQPYEIPDVLHNERYKTHIDFINTLNTHLQRHIALWCFNTIPILDHPRHGIDWIVVYYENLLINPQNQLKDIGEQLSINVPIEKIIFRKPSEMAVKKLYKPNPAKQLEKWKEYVDSKELDAIQRIFDYFQFDLYSTKDFLPIKTSKVFI